jgi:hypothetical protein
MLEISEQTYAQLIFLREQELMPKISTWLATEIPGWSATPGTKNWIELEEIMRVANKAGMLVETDYALFALLALTTAKDWRAQLSNPDALDMLQNDHIDPPSKLMWIEEHLG